MAGARRSRTNWPPRGAAGLYAGARAGTIGLRVSPMRWKCARRRCLPHAEIVALLNQRADWLWKHLDRLGALAPRTQLAALQQLWLLGRPLPIVRAKPAARRQLWSRAGVRARRRDDETPRRAAAETALSGHGPPPVCRTAARLCRALAHAAQRAQALTRARWGSCTYDGVIRLSLAAAVCPLPVIDYAGYELAHRIEMNHSSRFGSKWHVYVPIGRHNAPGSRQYGQHAPQW